jgi:multidrug efflux system membrane fusion protein
VAEDDLGKIQPQLRKRAKLEVDAFDRGGQKKIDKGTLLTLDNQIDTTTGTVKARAQFANKDSSLFPNQFVNMRLLVNTLQNATLIPTRRCSTTGRRRLCIRDRAEQGAPDAETVGVTNAHHGAGDGHQPGDVLATSSFDKLQTMAGDLDLHEPILANTSGSSAP